MQNYLLSYLESRMVFKDFDYRLTFEYKSTMILLTGNLHTTYFNWEMVLRVFEQWKWIDVKNYERITRTKRGGISKSIVVITHETVLNSNYCPKKTKLLTSSMTYFYRNYPDLLISLHTTRVQMRLSTIFECTGPVWITLTHLRIEDWVSDYAFS